MKCLSQLFPCGLLLLAVSSQPALAEDVFSTVMQGGFLTKENWTVTLGAGAIYGPKYEGSAESSVSPVPFVEINWNDTIFLSPGDGLGVNLYQNKGFVVGTSVGYDGGRQESDSRSELRGLGDIDAGVSTSGFLSYEYKFIKAETKVTHVFGGADGTTVDLGLQTFIPLAPLLKETPFFIGTGPIFGSSSTNKDGPGGPALLLGVSTTWADENYMDGYFGVSSQQSANSGLTDFDASAGFKSVTGDATLVVPLTDHINLGTNVGYTRLIGDAADSPITRDTNQFNAGLFATYTF